MLIAQDNGLELRSLVSIEGHQLGSSIHESNGELFGILEKPKGDLNVSEIRDEIRGAMLKRNVEPLLEREAARRRRQTGKWGKAERGKKR